MATRSGSTIYDTLMDAALAVGGATLRLASCTHLARIALGEQKVLHYILCGIEGPAGRCVDSSSTMPPQLLLYPTSSMESRTLAELIRRCLNVVVSSLGDGLIDVGTNREVESSRQSAIVVPGGGAAELTWSALLQEVATYLRRHGSAPPVVIKGSDVADNDCGQEQSGFQILAQEVSTTLLSGLPPRMWPACAELCDAMAGAYEAVPLQLIVNAEGLLFAGGSTNPLRVLLDWKSRLLEGRSAGRIGALVNPDLSSE